MGQKRVFMVTFVDPNREGDFLRLVREVTVKKLQNLPPQGDYARGVNGRRAEDGSEEANENSSLLPRVN